MEKRICLVLILGASEFPDLLSGHKPNEAFQNSARGIERYFNSHRKDLIAYRVVSLFDSALNVIEQGGKIEQLLQRNSDATDLIVYYVGHGGFIGGREYYLALKSTRQSLDHMTGLRISSLSSIINHSFADRRLFILLDCCFAGNAVTEWQSISSLGRVIENRTLQRLPPHGTAMLAASSKDDPAISPHGRPYTMFCECLLEVLHQGIAGTGPMISLDEVADRLRVLVNDRFGNYGSIPEIHSPRQKAGNIARWPLFPNPAYTAPALPSDLIAALGNPLPKVRAGAVGALEEFAAAADSDLSPIALHELERISGNDDSTLVKKHAADVLARVVDTAGSLTAAETSIADRDPSSTRTPELADDGKKKRRQAPGADLAAHRDPVAAPAMDRSAEGESEAPDGDPDEPARAPVAMTTLAVSIRPSRRRIPEGGEVTWTCRVSNAGPDSVRAIEVTDTAGTQLHQAFDLAAGQGCTFKLSRQYGQQGGRMTIAAFGQTDHSGLVAAKGSGVVSVMSTQMNPADNPLSRALVPKPQPPAPSSAIMHARLQESPQAADQGSIRPAAAPPCAASTASVDAPRFREAIRRVKATARLGDLSINQTLRMIGEGERHYRIAAGQLKAQPDWHRRVASWLAEVSALSTDELVMVQPKTPSIKEIIANIHYLVNHISNLTGIQIPINEFEPEKKEK